MLIYIFQAWVTILAESPYFVHALFATAIQNHAEPPLLQVPLK